MSPIRLTPLMLAVAFGCSPSKTNTAPASTKGAPAAASQSSAPKEKTPEPVATREGPLPIGAKATMVDAKMQNVDEKMVTIAAQKGEKGTLVVFTCNHCPYAKAWEGRIAKIGNEAQKMGFGVIAINSNDPSAYPSDGLAEMKVRAKEVGFAFPYVVDATSDVARAYGATKTPEVFLFDANDTLVYYGAVDDNYRDASKVDNHYLSEAVGAVAAGQPITKTVTKALGCSIKFRPPA